MKPFCLLFATLAIITVGWVATVYHSYSQKPLVGAIPLASEPLQNPPIDRIEFLLAKLQSGEPQNIPHSGKRLIAAHYQHLVGGLIRIAGNEGKADDDARRAAIELLGEIRSPEAIPVLLECVDWSGSHYAHSLSPLNGYPCAIALEKYGLSAVPDVMQWLERRDVSDKAIELFAWIFSIAYAPLGGDDEAIRVVNLRLVRRGGGARTEGLQRLLKKLDEISGNAQRRRDREGPAA